MPDNPATEGQNERRSFFTRRLPLETETCIFILVNALDVFMTYLLLQYGGFRESNGIANWFIAGWGIKGMVAYKFVMVAFVAVITQIIATRNVRVARIVLIVCSLIVTAVVIYSAVLFFGALQN